MSVQEIETAISQLPPADRAQISRWLEQFQPTASDRVSQDTAAIRARLREFVKEHEADRWLSAPNDLLGGASPCDAIARGQTERVSEILVRLEEGIYV
ncbi:MAG: MbcA/ParS/Xre antitoxin family protein [Armatimonadota bacterium]|nr:MbcA/ParS/Xre antitoxin family protein [Armatimonadota bacterium]